MRFIRALVSRLLASISDTGAREFHDELESHLQLHIDDNIRAGMTPDEARRHALLMLGGVLQTVERHRDRRLLPLFDTVRGDFVYARRTLGASPAFTATAVLTLALGIGATTAIFSVVNAVLLRPLPFADPERLVFVAAQPLGTHPDVVSYPTFIDWRNQSRSFDGAAAFAGASMAAAAGGESEFVRGVRVSPDMFDVLGIRPALGRPFRSGDETEQVVILSDGFWKRRFGGAPDAIGRTVRVTGGALADVPFTVVGVMPPGFRIESATEQLYTPLVPDPNRNHGFLRVIARLRDGISRRQAQADLDGITAAIRRQFPRSEARGSVVLPLVDALAGPGRIALLILLGVVSLVLLIACTNVASLMLARGATRQREIAIRAALGASRGRLTLQLLTESLVLASAGGAVGLLLANWLSSLLVKVVSEAVDIPRLDATRIDVRVLVFAALVSVATGILFGVVPALSSASADLMDAMRESSGSLTRVRAPRLRRALVVVETALALVLLSGAGVLMKSLIAMRSTAPGFDARNLLAVEVWLPQRTFDAQATRTGFYDRALHHVRAVPGVASAALIADLPLNGGTDSNGFHIVGRPDPPEGYFRSAFNIATAGYFNVLAIPVLEGRSFSEADGPDAPGVAVINDVAARTFWPGESPIGHQLRVPISRDRTDALTVVGVVANVRHTSLAQPPRAEIYVNAMQTSLRWQNHVLVARTAVSPQSVANAVTAAVHEADRSVPVTRVDTMEGVVSRSMAAPRLYSWLFTAFAAAAVTLAGVGLYGLISFSVSQRSKEIGVRLALGASRAEIVRIVLRQGLRLAATGAAFGLAGSVAATRTLVALLKEIEPYDPATFAIVTAVLLVVATLASYLPARRASRLDPLETLRAE